MKIPSRTEKGKIKYQSDQTRRNVTWNGILQTPYISAGLRENRRNWNCGKSICTQSWQPISPVRSIYNLVAVANRLGVTVDYLLSDSVNPDEDAEYLILRQLLAGRTKLCARHYFSMLYAIFGYIVIFTNAGIGT